MRENAPVIAKAIADEFKVSIAGLKQLGADGKLTSDRVFKANPAIAGTASLASINGNTLTLDGVAVGLKLMNGDLVGFMIGDYNLIARIVADAAAAIAAALAVLAVAYLKGRADNATSATAERLKAAKKARKIEDETNKLGGGDVDTALSRWMRDSR